MQGSDIWSEGWGNLPEVPAFKDYRTGIRYDFNYGFRIHTPENETGIFNVHIENDCGDTICDIPMNSGCKWCFPFKYFMKYRVVVTSDHGVFCETLDLRNEVVLIMCNVRTLGDSIAWLSAVPEFERRHDCTCVCIVNDQIYELFKDSTEIKVDRLQNKGNYIPYATYYLGLFFEEEYSKFWQPYDFRLYGLHEQAKNILGISDAETKPLTVTSSGNNPLAGDNYVCISYSASKANKFWNNPTGWKTVIDYLHSLNLKVVCIDKTPVCGAPPYYYYMPNNVIDMTGDLSLQERVDVLKGAKMFIGMASGLSWLAWCCEIPIIMISGFSLPYAEFYTPYRVINTLCNCTGCWNDTRIMFMKHDYMWCPRVDARIDEINKRISNESDEKAIRELKLERMNIDKERFICTQTITPKMVIAQINKVIEAEYSNAEK